MKSNFQRHQVTLHIKVAWEVGMQGILTLHDNLYFLIVSLFVQAITWHFGSSLSHSCCLSSLVLT
jgi:hypothetical protein